MSNAEDGGTKSMEMLVKESAKNRHGGASIVLTRCKYEPIIASVTESLSSIVINSILINACHFKVKSSFFC